MNERTEVIVCDLDGTLIRSDLLYECLFNAISRDWRIVFGLIGRALKGRAAIKSYLCSVSQVDVKHLPYNQEVLDRLDLERRSGAQLVLASASNQRLVDCVSDHLDLFDASYGSNEKVNLKGKAKADLLVKRFGKKGFTYIGDSWADLHVWAVCKSAVTVNVGSRLRRKVQSLQSSAEHLANSTDRMGLGRAIRPHQWVKNLLVFLPAILAHEVTSESAVALMRTFLAYSLVASSVYLFNDLLDLDADRAHPRKRDRPFASGAVPLSLAPPAILLLLLFGIALGASVSIDTAFVIGAYFVATLVYSGFLKRRVVWDICLLAGLFTMRLIGGGVAVEVELSMWLLAFSTFFFLSLASVKRQAELIDLRARGEAHTIGRGYKTDDINLLQAVSISSGYASIVVLALYINSPEFAALYSTPNAFWLICCIGIFWITRVVFLTHRAQMNDDPVVFALRDSTSRILLIISIALVYLSI